MVEEIDMEKISRGTEELYLKAVKGPELNIQGLLFIGCCLDAYRYWCQLYERDGFNESTGGYLRDIIGQLGYSEKTGDVVERLRTGRLGLEGLTEELEISKHWRESAQMRSEALKKLPNFNPAELP